MISEFHKSKLSFSLQSIYEQALNQIKLERSQIDCDGVSVEDAEKELGVKRGAPVENGREGFFDKFKNKK